MSMYLSNADLSPAGAEIAEFIDDIPTPAEVLVEVPESSAESEEVLARA